MKKLNIRNYIYTSNYSKMFQFYIHNIIGRLLKKKGKKRMGIKKNFLI